MDINEALELSSQLITTKATHQDYERTVTLAKLYKAMITGEEIESQLIQFIQREDAAAFAQRVRLTRSITPAVAHSVRRPFNKVVRNDRIVKKYKVQNETRNKAVSIMLKSFFGDPKKKNTGLDFWLKTRFLDLQFTDPNAWVVLQWSNPGNPSDVALVRPYEIPANEALNFEVDNDVVKWLWVGQEITFMKQDGEKQVSTDGMRYLLYDVDLTVVLEEVDKAYYLANTEEPTDTFITIGEGSSARTFAVQDFEPKVGYPPVIRVGYLRDDVTESRTFVNPWHAGLCFFDKLLTTVSELDLTIALHTFPQKLQYVSKCMGAPKKKCNHGSCADGSTCTRCNGKGYEIHTTAQEAILLPMPDDGKDMIPLENILVYKSPPIELIKFQNEYCLQLERQVHQAVFNSQVFIKNHYTENAAPTEEKTATEADMGMESAYDTLEPFTEKASEVWRDIVTTFGLIAGETLENIEVTHEFPADYKLKTAAILMAERARAVDSGAPGFLLEAIDDDLAGIQFNGDAYGLSKFKIKRSYFPFGGKTPDEIAELMSSEFVLDFDKILYANFENIFRTIERTDLLFYRKDPEARTKIVTDAVNAIVKSLKDANPRPVFNTTEEIPA